MKKTILAIGLGIAFSCATVTAMAANPGIKLSGSSLPGAVTVNCNGQPGLFPIPANSSLPRLPFSAIKAMFNLQPGTPANCTFSIGSTTVGTASLEITSAQARTLQIIQASPTPASGYAVSISSNGTPVTAPTGKLFTVNVTLSK